MEVTVAVAQDVTVGGGHCPVEEGSVKSLVGPPVWLDTTPPDVEEAVDELSPARELVEVGLLVVTGLSVGTPHSSRLWPWVELALIAES